MTAAERQARCRAARAVGKPVDRTRRPLDYRSRARRWLEAVAELAELQEQYIAWFEALPNETVTGEALQAICEFDLSELQAIEPPRGFARD
jgi:hypothetical protein